MDDFYHRARWQRKYAYWPCRSLNRSLIWFETAWVGKAMYTGPGLPVVETYWLTEAEYIVARLKGLIE